jgi:hypothetical protein
LLMCGRKVRPESVVTLPQLLSELGWADYVVGVGTRGKERADPCARWRWGRLVWWLGLARVRMVRARLRRVLEGTWGGDGGMGGTTLPPPPHLLS